MDEMRSANRILIKKPERKRPLERMVKGVSVGMVLKDMLKHYVKVCTGIIWLKTESSGWSCGQRNEYSGFIKNSKCLV